MSEADEPVARLITWPAVGATKEHPHGFLVVQRDWTEGEEVEPGDRVDVYPLAQPLQAVDDTEVPGIERCQGSPPRLRTWTSRSPALPTGLSALGRSLVTARVAGCLGGLS